MRKYNIKELLEKKYLGDKLDDHEMMSLIYHLGQTTELLVQMGGVFYLAFKESNSLYLELYSSATYRGLLLTKGYDLNAVRDWLNRAP